MKVEKACVEDDTPFATITLTRKETYILKKLLDYNIEKYRNGAGGLLRLPEGSNEYFAAPLYKSLEEILGE